MSFLCVESIGAVTPLGATAAQTMVGLAMRLQLFEELPVRDGTGEPLVAAPSPLELDGPWGPERLLALGAMALEECAAGGLARPTLVPPRGPLPVLLCVPGPGEDGGAEGGSALLEAIAAELPGRVDLRRSRVFAGGPAVVLQALVAAGAVLAGDDAEACYVGAIASLLDGRALHEGLQDRRIRTGDNATGHIPGEAAVFLRVARFPSRDAIGVMRGLGLGEESGSRVAGRPSTASGLCEAARIALGGAGIDPAAVNHVSHDASDEGYGFQEVIMALSRLALRRKERIPVWTPASCVGEIGVAAGALNIAHAVQFASVGMIQTPALVLAADRGPRRAAAVVDRNPYPSVHFTWQEER